MIIRFVTAVFVQGVWGVFVIQEEDIYSETTALATVWLHRHHTDYALCTA